MASALLVCLYYCVVHCAVMTDDWLWLLIQDGDQVDYSKIEPSADFFAPPRGTALLVVKLFQNSRFAIRTLLFTFVSLSHS